MTRYNELGQWKPFIFGGDEEFARSAAAQLSGNNEDLYGALFYIFYTGSRVLEFVVCTSFELPVQEFTSCEGKLRLWKCPRFHPMQTEVVYDGSWAVSGPNPDEILTALRKIPQALNRLAFTFRATVGWRMKYPATERPPSFANLSEPDLPLVERFLNPVGSEEELAVLDAAIDWYNRARRPGNIFTQFLGYYIAVESTAEAICDGSVNFGLNAPLLPRSARRHARDKIGHALRAVFGENSPLTQAVLEQDGWKRPLMKLRNDIAHGHYSLSNAEHYAEVASRLSQMSEIANQFIARLVLRLQPTDLVPGWSNRYISGISFNDPRGLEMADRKVIDAKIWSIRPEWCH